MLVHIHDVLFHLGLDILGAVGILEGVERLLELVARRRNVGNHNRAAVPPERVFQKACQLRVPVRHEALPRAPPAVAPRALEGLGFGCQGVDAVCQRQERSVDVGALNQPRPAVVSSRSPLGPRQIDEREFPDLVRLREPDGPLPLLHHNLKDRVRSAGRLVLLRRFNAPVVVALVEEGHGLLDRRRRELRDARHTNPLDRVLPEIEVSGRGVEQIPDVLVVHLQVSQVHPVDLGAVCRDSLEKLRDSVHHDPRVLDVPEHGVRLPRARRAVREARGVEAVHHPREQLLSGRLIHLLLGAGVVEGLVEGVASLSRAALPEVVLVLPTVELVAVEHDDHLVVEDAHCVGLQLLHVVERPNPHSHIDRVDS
mmetsp:Transcript_5675/g.13068  ORF Transcript_5675/g.13068 Transcript_5675/m.13068 type:complete len:369 (-) Transcript_5675:333-1439(-)